MDEFTAACKIFDSDRDMVCDLAKRMLADEPDDEFAEGDRFFILQQLEQLGGKLFSVCLAPAEAELVSEAGEIAPLAPEIGCAAALAEAVISWLVHRRFFKTSVVVRNEAGDAVQFIPMKDGENVAHRRVTVRLTQ